MKVQRDFAERIEKGANVDAKDEAGRTAFHWAAWRGHIDVVKFFD